MINGKKKLVKYLIKIIFKGTVNSRNSHMYLVNLTVKLF